MPAFGAAMVEVEPDLNRFGPTLRRKLGGLDGEAKKAGSKFGSVFAASFSTAMAIGVVGGVAALGLAKFGKYAVDVASDTQEAWSKVAVVFGDQAEDLDKWSKGTAKSLGISRREALEAAGDFGNMFTTIGLGVGENAKMSKSLVELAADMASFNNVPIADALEKLRAGLAGEAEPLRTMGVLLSEARVKTKAYELGIAEVGAELTEAQKVQARYALILEDTAVQQGDAVRTGEDLAGLQKRVGAQWEDLAGKLGMLLLPIVEKFFNYLADEGIPALENLVAKIEDNWPEIQATAEEVWTGLLAVVTAATEFTREEAIPVAQFIADWIRENWPQIRATAEEVWSGVKTALKEVADFGNQYVVPTVKAIHNFIVDHWPTVQRVAQQVWSAIKKSLQEVADFGNQYVVPTVRAIHDFITRNWPTMKAVGEAVLGAVTGALVAMKRDGIDPMISGISSFWGWLLILWTMLRRDFVGPIIGALQMAKRDGIDPVIGAVRSLVGWLDSLADKFGSVKRTLSGGLSIPGIGGVISGLGSLANPSRWFHSGGIVPGRPGEDVVAVLQAGEAVLTRGQQSWLADALASPMGNGTTVTINAPAVAPLDERELVRQMQNARWLTTGGRV